jgi:response regulator RpfG family c-di-GMP phosphodiesterase
VLTPGNGRFGVAIRDTESALRELIHSRDPWLAACAGHQCAITAINEVGLFQYLEKPWDNAQLLLVIRAGVERARLLRELREKVSALDSAHSTLKDAQRRLL